MTREEFAKKLDGRSYPFQITGEEEKEAKENNLIVIYGASDDLCEVRGWIDDEFDVYDGGEVSIGPIKVNCVWCPEKEGHVYASWDYEIPVDHSEFRIIEDDEIYCIGAVIDATVFIGLTPSS